MLRLLGNRVLIRREPPPEDAAGVFLPDVARVYPQLGRVIATGDRGEAMTFAGELAAGLQPLVMYSKYESPVVTEKRSGIREDGTHSLHPKLDDELLVIDGDRLICRVG